MLHWKHCFAVPQRTSPSLIEMSGIFPEGKTGKMGYPQKKFGYTCVPSDNQLKLLTDHLVLVLPSVKHI